MEVLTLVAQYVPQFLFALVLFYMCQQSADKQRDAYQVLIRELYEIAREAMSRQRDLMDRLDRQVGKD